MVQTVRTIWVSVNEKKIILEKPHKLRRIFFSVQTIAQSEPMCKTLISFDDPLFISYYVLGGATKYIRAEGAYIFQGNIWVQNVSMGDLEYTATEILQE